MAKTEVPMGFVPYPTRQSMQSSGSGVGAGIASALTDVGAGLGEMATKLEDRRMFTESAEILSNVKNTMREAYQNAIEEPDSAKSQAIFDAGKEASQSAFNAFIGDEAATSALRARVEGEIGPKIGDFTSHKFQKEQNRAQYLHHQETQDYVQQVQSGALSMSDGMKNIYEANALAVNAGFITPVQAVNSEFRARQQMYGSVVEDILDRFPQSTFEEISNSLAVLDMASGVRPDSKDSDLFVWLNRHQYMDPSFLRRLEYSHKTNRVKTQVSEEQAAFDRAVEKARNISNLGPASVVGRGEADVQRFGVNLEPIYTRNLGDLIWKIKSPEYSTKNYANEYGSPAAERLRQETIKYSVQAYMENLIDRSMLEPDHPNYISGSKVKDIYDDIMNNGIRDSEHELVYDPNSIQKDLGSEFNLAYIQLIERNIELSRRKNTALNTAQKKHYDALFSVYVTIDDLRSAGPSGDQTFEDHLNAIATEVASLKATITKAKEAGHIGTDQANSLNLRSNVLTAYVTAKRSSHNSTAASIKKGHPAVTQAQKRAINDYVKNSKPKPPGSGGGGIGSPLEQGQPIDVPGLIHIAQKTKYAPDDLISYFDFQIKDGGNDWDNAKQAIATIKMLIKTSDGALAVQLTDRFNPTIQRFEETLAYKDTEEKRAYVSGTSKKNPFKDAEERTDDDFNNPDDPLDIQDLIDTVAQNQWKKTRPGVYAALVRGLESLLPDPLVPDRVFPWTPGGKAQKAIARREQISNKDTAFAIEWLGHVRNAIIEHRTISPDDYIPDDTLSAIVAYAYNKTMETWGIDDNTGLVEKYPTPDMFFPGNGGPLQTGKEGHHNEAGGKYPINYISGNTLDANTQGPAAVEFLLNRGLHENPDMRKHDPELVDHLRLAADLNSLKKAGWIGEDGWINKEYVYDNWTEAKAFFSFLSRYDVGDSVFKAPLLDMEDLPPERKGKMTDKQRREFIGVHSLVNVNELRARLNGFVATRIVSVPVSDADNYSQPREFYHPDAFKMGVYRNDNGELDIDPNGMLANVPEGVREYIIADFIKEYRQEFLSVPKNLYLRARGQMNIEGYGETYEGDLIPIGDRSVITDPRDSPEYQIATKGQNRSFSNKWGHYMVGSFLVQTDETEESLTAFLFSIDPEELSKNVYNRMILIDADRSLSHSQKRVQKIELLEMKEISRLYQIEREDGFRNFQSSSNQPSFRRSMTEVYIPTLYRWILEQAKGVLEAHHPTGEMVGPVKTIKKIKQASKYDDVVTQAAERIKLLKRGNE